MAPITTTGRSSATTRWSSQAVSSSVFVPCVITTPSASSRTNSPRTSSTRSARSSSVRACARSRRNGTSRHVGDGGELRGDPVDEARRARGGRRCPGTPRGRAGRCRAESIVPPVVTIATRARGRRTRDQAVTDATSAAWSAADVGRSARAAAVAGRLPVGRGLGRRVALHARDQPPDAQPLDRPERVQRHRLEPDRRPEAHGVRAGPEVLAAVVEVADAAEAMIGSRMPASRSSDDDAQPDRLDRAARHRPVAVLEVRLAGLGIQPQRLDRVDRGERRAARTPRRGAHARGSRSRADLEDHRVAAPGTAPPEARPRGSSRTGS